MASVGEARGMGLEFSHSVLQTNFVFISRSEFQQCDMERPWEVEDA